MDMQQLLQVTVERNASDLHMVVGTFPAFRIDGVLYQMATFPLLTAELTQQLLLSIMTNEQKENLIANKEIDFGYEMSGHRFRANVYHTRNALSASFRYIPKEIHTVDKLMLPSSISEISNFNNGLVLVTGPTGEGKSTTLASIINKINQTTSSHIVTVEDPIEYVYPLAKSIISQRELHEDTHSWNIALRSVLREDPDVVLVGEIRDYESAALVLTIAETGHLVFSTLHTTSTPETINRLIDMFPSHQQNQVKSQLAGVLRAVVAQRLLPRADMRGRIPAVELLYNTPAVSAIIREGKPFLLDNVLQTSEGEGFIYFERYLAQLHSQGYISRETAKLFAIRPKDLEKYLK
jgi:twitching motility protein PilT